MITPERPLTGEPLPLDLVNTWWLGSAGPVDLFDARGGVAAWLAEHDLEVSEDAEGPLRRTRDALRALLDDPDDATAGAALDDVLERGRVRWGWRDGHGTTEVEVAEEWRAAWAAAVAYVDLVEAKPERVRRCAGRDCVLVFLDTSRNGRRRWCSMETCGARAKAADYYRRRTGRA